MPVNKCWFWSAPEVAPIIETRQHGGWEEGGYSPHVLSLLSQIPDIRKWRVRTHKSNLQLTGIEESSANNNPYLILITNWYTQTYTHIHMNMYEPNGIKTKNTSYIKSLKCQAVNLSEKLRKAPGGFDVGDTHSRTHTLWNNFKYGRFYLRENPHIARRILCFFVFLHTNTNRKKPTLNYFL